MTTNPLRAAFAIGTLVLTACLFGLIVDRTLKAIGQTHTAVASIPDGDLLSQDDPVLAREVVEKMIARQVISLDTTTFRISMPDCSETFEPVENLSASQAEEARSLAEISCRGFFRETIRAPIETWNAGLQVAAVRDTSDGTALEVEEWVRPRGRSPARWSANVRPVIGFGDEAAVEMTFPADIAPGEEPSSDLYGYVLCNAQSPGFGDWLTVRGDTLNFSRPVKAGDTFQLQLIGSAEDGGAPLLRLEGRDIAPTSRVCASSALTTGGHRRCIEGSLTSRCEGDAQALNTYEVRAGRDGEISVSVRTQPIIPMRLSRFRGAENITALGIDIEGKSGRSEESVGDGPLAVQCWTEDSGTKACRLAWAPKLPRKQSSAGSFAALTLSGFSASNETEIVVNTETAGALPSLQEEYGLMSVLGVGLPDYVSLDATWPSNVPANLTLDRHMQAVTWRTLKAALQSPSTFPSVNPGQTLTGLPPGHNRTAAVVLIDASDDASAGDILAAASWPQLGAGLHAWDIEAMRAWDPEASPLLPVAWSDTSKHQTPGSTFKIVSALALTQTALDDPDSSVGELLEGASSDRTRELTGMNCSATGIEIPGRKQPIRNADAGETACHGISGVSSCKRHRSSNEHLHGLCEATAISNNIWFSQMSLLAERGFHFNMTDAEKRLACELPRDEALSANASLERVIHALGWQSGSGRGLNLLTGEAGTGRVYERAVVPYAESLTPGNGDCARVALNSYGQAAQASPLAMASFAAGLARRNLTPPLPRLARITSPIASGLPRPLLTATPDRQDDLDAYVDILKVGLNAVVNDPAGSSATAFCVNATRGDCALMPGLRQRVFAKTGTATPDETVVGKPTGYSAWLVGWVEPAPPGGTGRSRINRRIAFACMVSHTYASSNQSNAGFGGAVCGPIMARLLLDLEMGRGADE